MAFPVTLNGRTYTLADFEGNNYVDGLPDAFEDFVTQAGDIYNSTSTSSVTIGTGSKTFTTADSGKPYQAGTPLRIADAAAPSTNFMDSIVTSYSGTTLVVNVIGTVGSGTKSSWTINIGGTKLASGGAITGDSLSVSGTATVGDDLAVDTDTLFVDASANSVGINESSPARTFEVNSSDTVAQRWSNSGANNYVEMGTEAIQSPGSVRFGTTGGSFQLLTGGNADYSGEALALTVDFIGRVGIGVSPTSKLDVGSGDWVVQQASEIKWQNTARDTTYGGIRSSASTLDFNWNGSAALSIDSSGNVGIGATPVATGYSGTNTTLYVENASAAALTLDSTGGSGRSMSLVSSTAGSLDVFDEDASATRMRIDASGNVLVGKTSSGFGNGCELSADGNIYARAISEPVGEFGRGTTNGELFVFNNAANNQVGNISVTPTDTTYNTTSDVRLKENITDADDSGSTVDAIQVRQFNWKLNGKHQDYGFIAQELEPIYPDAVSKGEGPNDIWGVDYSKLIPLLVKEIQQLRARVATLEAN